MAPPTTIYLVTGAGRGIGFSVVQILAQRPNTIVYAGVRTLPLLYDSDLGQIVKDHPTTVIPVQLKSADEADGQAASQTIKDQVGKVDVIIANAGKSTGNTSLKTVTVADLKSDFEVNTIGPIVLYQAFAPLLLASDQPGGPKFVIVTSLLAQIKDSMPYEYEAYAISKAGANFVAKKVDQMNPGVVGFPISPGVVDTDMGKAGAAALGLTVQQFGGISPEDSAQGILNVIDNATKETHGGKFWSYTGDELTY